MSDRGAQFAMQAVDVVVVGPFPPPEGGIATWMRIVRDWLAADPTIGVRYVDSAVRWRSEADHRLAVRLLGGLAQATRDALRLYRLLRSVPTDVVHLTTSAGPASVKDVLMLRIARQLRIPAVIHFHMGRLPEVLRRGGPEARLIRECARLATCCVVLDRESLKALRGAVGGASIVQLPNMVQLDRVDDAVNDLPAAVPPLPPGTRRIVFAGHVIPSKGVEELVRACAAVKHEPWVLEIVGASTPGFRERLQELARAEEVEDRVHFHGRVGHDRVLQMMAASDLFVLPSYTEGFPNVVMEAMGCGRAILATSVGAIPEMLEVDGPEPCGVCVEPKSVSALARTIEALLSDQAFRAQLGKRARRRVERLYSVPIGCGMLADLWRSLAQASTPRPQESPL